MTYCTYATGGSIKLGLKMKTNIKFFLKTEQPSEERVFFVNNNEDSSFFFVSDDLCMAARALSLIKGTRRFSLEDFEHIKNLGLQIEIRCEVDDARKLTKLLEKRCIKSKINTFIDVIIE